MKTNKALNICLVGCGGMASNYRHRYTQIDGAQLALLIDINAEVAKEAAQKLGIRRWSTNFEDALSRDIDIVDISTPNFLHEQQAVAALNAGKHVFLQKPIAPTVEAARTIVDAGKKNGRQAGIYMSLFDMPVYHDVKSIVSQGMLGRISSIHCRGAHAGGLNMHESNWRSSVEMTGGGSFIQLAIHPLNMVQNILSEKVVRVSAFSKNIMCPNVGGDDITSVACEFESGIQGTLESSYCADPFILSIYGTDGFVSVYFDNFVHIRLDNDVFDGNVIHYSKPGTLVYMQADDLSVPLEQRDNPFDQHIAFVEAVKEGREAPVSAEDGLYDLKIVKAVYRAAEEKRIVEVNGI